MNRHLHHQGNHTHAHGLRHWLHDPRFWAATALIGVIALLILAVLLAPNTGSRAYQPISYPYLF